MLRQIKNFIIYYSARAAMALTGLVPARLSPGFGRFLGAAAHTLAPKERNIARRQIAEALEMDEGSRRVTLLTRAVFNHFGTSAVEICRILRSGNRAPRVIIPETTRQILDRAMATGKGVIFATGHLGNWELMAMALAVEGYPISTVAKESYDSRFTIFMDKARRKAGVEAIYRGSAGFSIKLVRALRKNRILGFLIDQDTSVPSAFVPFFKKQAHTPLGAASVSLRTGAMVVVGSTYRTRKGDHIIEMEYLGETRDVLETTANITNILERRIRNRPSQWVWFHKRWKTRPSQSTDSKNERAA